MLDEPDEAEEQLQDDSAPVPSATNDKPRIPVPGPFFVMIEGHIESVLVGNDAFTEQVVAALAGTKKVFRYGGAAGVVRTDETGTSFMPLTREYVRGLIDQRVTLIKTKVVEASDGNVVRQTEIPANADHGSLVLDRLSRDEQVPPIQYLSDWPVYAPGWEPVKSGWNPGGYYYAEPAELEVVSRLDSSKVVPHQKIHEYFDDLTADFPFKTAADKANFISLLLTFLARPALGNVPLFLVQATRERVGKSKLLTEVLGPTVFGRDLITSKMKEDDAEVEKGITSVLKSGRPYMFWDNVDRELGGEHLCALLTSRTLADRVLGSTNHTVFRNNLIVMATSNNAVLAKDMNGRTVGINLVPLDSQPERRTNFRHPDIGAYALERRAKTLIVLRSMIENWRNAGCPAHPTFSMGSFEGWARSIGGIMWHNGYRDWMTNWAFQTSDLDNKVADLMRVWLESAKKAGSTELHRWTGSATTITPKALLKIAKGTEFIAEVEDRIMPEGAKLVALGKRLIKIVERPVRLPDGEWVIERATTQPTTYRLRPAGGTSAPAAPATPAQATAAEEANQGADEWDDEE
jgi:hypothetical protein